MPASLKLFLVACLLSVAAGFYLPGVAPQEYKDGEEVSILVSQLSSTKTQLPYEYYSLPWPAPKETISVAENLGEVLQGERTQSSLYKAVTGKNEYCKVIGRDNYSEDQIKEFVRSINEEYRGNLVLDHLPVATKKMREDNGEIRKMYEKGYALGVSLLDEGKPSENAYLHNHLRFTVLYHTDSSFEGSRIVGFEVEPFSIQHAYDGTWDDSCLQTGCNIKTCLAKDAVIGDGNVQKISTTTAGNTEIIWTYDVIWESSDVKWASRWDTYLYMADDQIHWFSILNSLMIVLFLTGLVAMIMMRTLNNDFRHYEQLEASEEQEETGWKLVHGDVFRPPQYAGLLAVFVGTGVQTFGMVLILLAFTLLGFLSPANRGALMSAMLFLFVFMGTFGGYYSQRVYKMFKGVAWKSNALKTAILFPGIIFAIFFILNLFIWGEKSSGAVPFGTLVALVAMWFGVSVPLVLVGSYFGYKKKAVEHPVRTNQIPRQVPPQAWYMQPVVSILIGGILPFGAVFVELFFILSSIWLQQVYYIFGFLFVVFVILVLTCAEITIVMCYFQLCSEDYHWWWRSFLTSGSCSLYLFLYAIFYNVTKLELTRFVSGMLFFGYMFIASIVFFVVTGTIGFVSCLLFVRKIYSSVHVD